MSITCIAVMKLCYRYLYCTTIQIYRLSVLRSSERHFGSKRKMEETKRKWLQCGSYDVFAWSIAGLETNVVVKADNLSVAFDMGYSSRECLRCQNVFISHGHMDHISAVPQHAAKRNLFGMKKANYYVPPHITNVLKSIAESYLLIDETTSVLSDLNILPFDIGDKVELAGGYFVKSFPTVHRIRSQGYILYKKTQKLKTEYVGMSGIDVSAMYREGVEIHDIVESPEIAYLGDTTFEVFLSPPTPDLLKVKVLIMEATYIEDNQDRITQAQARGHTHFSEIIENAELFKDVENIVIMHLSDKYSISFLKENISSRLPESLKHKVHIASWAKERTA